MRNRRLARRLLCLFCFFCLMPGCQMLPKQPSLTVLVRDAETKKPIATAEVYLCQCLAHDEVAPCRSKGLTQADGIARLRAEPVGTHGFQVQTVAQGYLPEKVNVPAAAALKKKAAPPSSPETEPHPADAIVDVYAEPNFSVELVLPPGYRGLVKAEIQVSDNLPVPAGQRCFRYLVSASGDVLVKGPSLLRRVPVQDFRARYGNGPLLGTTLDAEKVGFRWLRGMGNRQFFVVGTQMDYEVLHRQIAPEESQPAFDSAADAERAAGSNKYRYGKISAPNYEPNKK